MNVAGTDGVATAVAHPNIALVKYWGKRSEELLLPVAGSLSMTLDVHPTTTTVELTSAAGDEVFLNGVMVASGDGRVSATSGDGRVSATSGEGDRVRRFLELVRARTGRTEHAVVRSVNTGPTGAGLASSASGFAALALACAHVYGLNTSSREVSRLARRGSGSACRSIFGGFAVWHPGVGDGIDGDTGSYAEQVSSAIPDPAMVITVVDAGPKPIGSREAMRHTVATSPLYRAWVDENARDIELMVAALAVGNLAEVGRIAEHNALGMHATMLAARPAIRYVTAGSMAVLDSVTDLRAEGMDAYATIDAGPNVVIWCNGADADRIAARAKEISAVESVVVARPGPGAHLVDTAMTASAVDESAAS